MDLIGRYYNQHHIILLVQQRTEF